MIASSQSAQVRIGICDFNEIPGLVWDRSKDGSLLRSTASRRLVAAVLIRANRAAYASVTWRGHPQVEFMRGE